MRWRKGRRLSRDLSGETCEPMFSSGLSHSPESVEQLAKGESDPPLFHDKRVGACERAPLPLTFQGFPGSSHLVGCSNGVSRPRRNE